jgi:methyl-accepting chemotaxis protein PixJ
MRSLRTKIPLQMLAVGVIPVVALGVIIFVALTRATGTFSRELATSSRIMEAEVVGANLSNDARSVMAEIDTYLRERIKDVRIWAQDPLVVEAAIQADRLSARLGWPRYPQIAKDRAAIEAIEKKMEKTRSLNPLPKATEYLKQQLAESKVFKELFFTDRNGFNVAISNLTSDFVQSDEEWWVRGWEKGIDIGKVGFDESAGVFSVDVHVRIHDPATGNAVGVMKAVLDISAVQAIASRKAAEIPDGDVKVFLGNGMLLADTSVKHDLRFIMKPEGNLLAKRFRPAELVLKEGKSGYLFGASEFHGMRPAAEQVIGYAKSGGAEFFKDVPNFAGFGWGATVAQGRATALAPLRPLTVLARSLEGLQRSLGLLVAIIGVAAAAASAATGLWMSRRIVKPILHLSHAADQISLGELDAQIRVKSRDEIGTLAESIERMRTSLKAAIERMRARRAGETPTVRTGAGMRG